MRPAHRHDQHIQRIGPEAYPLALELCKYLMEEPPHEDLGDDEFIWEHGLGDRRDGWRIVLNWSKGARFFQGTTLAARTFYIFRYGNYRGAFNPDGGGFIIYGREATRQADIISMIREDLEVLREERK